MSEARGGVLFIDEAYGLMNNAFGREAIEALLANLTSPDFDKNLVVILAGYPDELQRLLNANAGMRRRFTGSVDFQAWGPKDCSDLVRSICLSAGSSLHSDCEQLLLEGFAELARCEGFGNAGDATVLAQDILEEFSLSTDGAGGCSHRIPGAVVQAALGTMLSHRPKLGAMPSRVSDAGAAAVSGGSAPSNSTRRAETPAAAAPLLEVELEAALLEEGERADEVTAPPLPTDLITASLDAALRARSYGLYQTRDVLVAAPPLPDDLLDHVSRLVGAPVSAVSPALHAQCKAVLERVEAAIREEELEAERVREAQRAIEAANEAERVRLREAEEARKRARLAVYICGVCGRIGCPVMPLRYEFDEGSAMPSNNGTYNGRPAGYSATGGVFP